MNDKKITVPRHDHENNKLDFCDIDTNNHLKMYWLHSYGKQLCIVKLLECGAQIIRDQKSSKEQQRTSRRMHATSSPYAADPLKNMRR